MDIAWNSRPASTSDDIRSLVRPDHVHRRAYADPAVFQLEQERIFGRLWIYVAHESQLKKPGDFVRTRLAAYEVLVTRHTDGKIYVLQNRCPHRGARICMVDRGNSKVFSCPYHAWSFRPDGSLDSVPHRKSYPDAFSLDDPQNHMQRIGRVASYRGFVFATLNENPAPLTEHLGPMTEVIDNLVDRAPDGEIEIADFKLHAGVSRQLEAPSGERRRHLPSELRAFLLGRAGAPRARQRLDPRQGPDPRDAARKRLRLRRVGEHPAQRPPGGHAYMNNIYNKGVLANQDTDPVAARYRAALTERLGAENAARVLAMNRFNNIIYPNLVINAQYQQMRVTIPISVDRTIVRIHCFRLKGAPDEMFHRAVRFLTTLGSPVSMIFSDDVEMLERCQQGLAQDVGPWIDFSRGIGTRPARTRRQHLGRGQRDADAGAVPGLGQLHDRRGGVMLDYATQRRIELFLFEEARLLDAGQFEEWLKLYEPQGIYWMPSQPGQTDPLNVASIMYEDHAILSIRVQRLLEARALVLTPMPRTTHLVSNIEAQEADGGEFTVGAAFICVEHQAEKQSIYSGRHAYQLTRKDHSFRIKMKRVALVNGDGMHSPMAMPL